MKNIFSCLFLVLLFTHCKQSTTLINTNKESLVSVGTWRVQLDLGEVELPFNLLLNHVNGAYSATILNAEEKITSENLKFVEDSVFWVLPVFNSEFRGKIINKDEVTGYWYNYDKCCDYKIEFTAKNNQPYRFERPKEATSPFNFSGKWEVSFSPNTEDEYKAIGAFKQNGNELSGTFMTETGDYRFLEGNVYGNNLYLSCFDGSHAFLFNASANPTDSTISGNFYSGKHWAEQWKAKRNDGFELSNPDSLTYLKKGYDELAFTFPNLSGTNVSYPSEEVRDKVIIIQIMGSWCPNCMDETRFLVDMYKKYHQQGLEIFSLCFERSSVFEEAAKNVNRHKNHLNAEWDFLITGQNGKNQAANALPMLNHIMSFPTTIFIDKKGIIRKIHTGFYGPSTGSYYQRFYESTNDFLRKLIAE